MTQKQKTSLQDEHSMTVRSLIKPGHEVLLPLTPADCYLLHAAIGICGEAGELADAIKKATIYRKELDLENVIEEMGDIEFFLEALRSHLNISRAETLQANIDKLRKRYPEGGYSDNQAQVRADKV